MKNLFTFLVLIFIFGLTAQGQDVKVKITYEGKPVVGHTVTALIGGGSIGSGVTNTSGEVSFSVSSLPTKSLDLKGEKTCDNGRKTWEVSGYVTLDGSNYAHLKMEEPIAEMAEASGGFMSADMLVSAYGLVCSGSSSSSSSSSGSAANSTDSNSDDDKAEAEETDDSSDLGTEGGSAMTYEERLEAQKSHLENKVYSGEKKIAKKQAKLEKKGLSDADKADLNYDIQVLELEKEMDQNKLDKTNLTIEKGGPLGKRERDEFKTKERELKDQLKALKEKQKSSSAEASDNKGKKKGEDKSSSAEASDDKDDSKNEMSTDKPTSGGDDRPSSAEASDDKEDTPAEADFSLIDFDPAKVAAMSDKELKKKRGIFFGNVQTTKSTIKFRGKKLEASEKAELEAEIFAYEKAIELMKAELKKREAVIEQ